MRKIQKFSNYLITFLGVSLVLYIVEINDWILSYEIFIDLLFIPIIISFIVFFILTIIELNKSRQAPSIISISIFAVFLITFVFLYGYRNGLFFGKKIIDSSFLDDRSRMDLKLYENGKYIIFSNWLFGENRFEGNYKLNGDTIVFNKTPVTDNDFISKKIIINRKENRIYFRKKKDGNYDKSFYYFQINFKK